MNQQISTSTTSSEHEEEFVIPCKLDSKPWKNELNCISSCSSTDDGESDMSEELDRKRYELFIEDYFYQQYLNMQDRYPSSFKSKQNKHQELSCTTDNLYQLSNSTIDASEQQPITAFVVACYGQQQQHRKQQQQQHESKQQLNNVNVKEKVSKHKKIQKLWKKVKSWGRTLVSGTNSVKINNFE